jgi:hypothetical protein
LPRLLRPAPVISHLAALPLALGLCFAALATTAEPAAAAPATAAAPVTTTDPAKAAAGWLARQFKGGTHLESCVGNQCFPDYGLTADAVLGMASAKVSGTAIDKATTWMAANAAAYIGADDGTGPYAGSYAKLALVAEVTGRDPAAFGGVDLLASLRALQCPHAGCAAGEAGAFRNTLPDGGFANDVTQSLSILALSRSSRPADKAAIPAAATFLTKQRCGPAGGFPTFFRTPRACASDVDATAFAVQALLAAGRAPTGAVKWLVAARRPGGGYVGNGVANANSTGLAIQALSAAGRNTSAAAAFLAGLRMGCSAAPANRGAISYDGVANFTVATAARATPQGIFGFTRVPLAELTASGVSAGAPVLACGTAPPGPPARVIGQRVSLSPQLAATGTDVRPLLGTGILCLLVGMGLAGLSRRTAR